MSDTFNGDILLFCELANKHAWGYRKIYDVTPTGNIIEGYRCSECNKSMPKDFTNAETNFMHGDASAIFTELKPFFGIEDKTK